MSISLDTSFGAYGPQGVSDNEPTFSVIDSYLNIKIMYHNLDKYSNLSLYLSGGLGIQSAADLVFLFEPKH